MSWRPHDPQKPDFKYRPVKQNFFNMEHDYEQFEVMVNDNIIGVLHCYKGILWTLGRNSNKSYTLEEASMKLWSRLKQTD
jgi:hypothetical protein